MPTIRRTRSRRSTNLLTVANDFESWSALSEKFFDEETGIVTQAIAASGKGE